MYQRPVYRVNAVTRVSIEGYKLAPQEKSRSRTPSRSFTTAASRLSRLGGGKIEPGRLPP